MAADCVILLPRLARKLYSRAMKKALLISLAGLIIYLSLVMSDAIMKWSGLTEISFIASLLGILAAIFMYGAYGGNPLKHIPLALLLTFTLIGISQLKIYTEVVINDPDYLIPAAKYIGVLTLVGLVVVWLRRKVCGWKGRSTLPTTTDSQTRSSTSE